MVSLNPDDPPPAQGRTLWEMMQAKLRPGQKSPPDGSPPPSYPNPLDWAAGVSAPLNESHGSEFKDSLILVSAVRHVVRELGKEHFDFIDYPLRITSRQGPVSHVCVRCLPNDTLGWDKFLLRRHDEFAYDPDFEELLADESGLFNIEDDTSGSLQFARLHQLQGPWEATAYEHLSAATMPAAKPFRYWDYSRMDLDGEELLFIEMDQSSGWTQLWRGHKVII